MRIVVLLLALCCSTCARSQPATQPALPPKRMTAELTGPVSLEGQVPLTLKLFSTDDGQRRYFTNYSFIFVLLDENGQQIGRPYVFVREAIVIKLELDGKEATYKPNLSFYSGIEGLVVGRKYQLMCAMPQCDLGAAVWFTLTN